MSGHFKLYVIHHFLLKWEYFTLACSINVRVQSINMSVFPPNSASQWELWISNSTILLLYTHACTHKNGYTFVKQKKFARMDQMQVEIFSIKKKCKCLQYNYFYFSELQWAILGKKMTHCFCFHSVSDQLRGQVLVNM